MALRLARVSACADELRLMGVERDGEPAGVGRAGGGNGSLARKLSRAWEPPATERMWRGPWRDGPNCTMHIVEGGRRLRNRHCSLVGRLVATNKSRFCEGTVLSRLVIDTMSNPMWYCSRASPKVQYSGPHWTRNSSTKVDRRPWRTHLGSLRPNICWMVALSPGASLLRRGSMVVARRRLAGVLRLGAFVFLL